MNNPDFFNDELLEKLIDTFYGYGNFQGKYWFIGMEESGQDFKDINNRINIWNDRKQKEIEDVAEYHIAMGAWDTKLQPTWNKLIRIVLSAKGNENINIEDVRKYQFNELGRKDKETCLLELLPLPSPSLAHWIYKEHSRLSYLTDRNQYEKHCLENRINTISEKIKEHQPQAVVFYGKGYEYYWRTITQKITDVEFLATSEGFLTCKNSQTIFVISQHPVSMGLKNEYFHNIGKIIAANPT
ncbi:hypothetical protein [Nodularia sphaerocarpa]|uniref:hypothetical protein n=1 Tax=Nodularia sphaerocarpa TaxID=137816 RepID=UPI001EFBEADE|nr:hypothetical protein [Nodularia sphaerocarpa]MDB9375242.1 hypothetical protein [Nodularia sphaerocarpa CS-585]MDB9376516.1 hypothetical protein [Nodularia sphaerocarpa CS-585A2]ULP72593.1 hypothetical protein BDGGKGIB_02237 [Nodularia sphaerocarpa UHCC 0038]